MFQARQLLSIVRGEVREPIFLAMLNEAVRPGTSLIEVGSSDGFEANHLIKKYGEAVRIYILEPDSVNRERIKKKLSNRKNVYLFDKAVSDVGGRSKFYVNKRRRNLSTVIPGAEKEEEQEVDCVTLVDFIEENGIKEPIVIKMDIEGYEVEVLRGSLDYLIGSNDVKVLMEVHPLMYDEKRSLREVLVKMFEAGYKVALLETAALPRPEKFVKMGLEPVMTGQGRGCYERGLYKDVDNEFVLEVACQKQLNPIKGPRRFTEKIVRSLLLSKNS
jgi:FkbM family methyltransferase